MRHIVSYGGGHEALACWGTLEVGLEFLSLGQDSGNLKTAGRRLLSETCLLENQVREHTLGQNRAGGL